jgi:hypothetical protein
MRGVDGDGMRDHRTGSEHSLGARVSRGRRQAGHGKAMWTPTLDSYRVVEINH